jgi:2-polyprenyl-3-methyl-5-hydroxy-6-metoxy-1,4-benzoquinol methylase
MRYPVKDRVSYILSACQGRRVLHVGCADAPYTQNRFEAGTLLHAAIEEVAAEQYGIDLSEEGIAFLQRNGFKNLAIANVEDLRVHNPLGQDKYDVIVAGEIIEHLPNPGLFLDAIKPLLKQPNGRLVLTTINATNAFRLTYMLLRGEEIVHPDHVSYYSRKTLIKLLTLLGFEVEDFAYFDIGQEHSVHIQGRTRLLLWADRFGTWLRPEFSNGVMVTCRLA